MTRPDTREDVLSLGDDDLAKLAEANGASVAWATDPEFHHVIEATPEQIRAMLAATPTPPAADEQDDEARRDGWSLFEADYLTDGEGHAPAATYAACRNAFDSAWGDGNTMEATRAAISVFKRLHPRAPTPPAAEAPGQEPVAGEIERVMRAIADEEERYDGISYEAIISQDLSRNRLEQKARAAILAMNRPAPTKQEPVAELPPIFLPGGLGDRLSTAMTAYLADYAYDPNPDEGFADHELTEFERGMMEDFLAGAISDEGVNAILQEAARAVSAPPTYADAEAKGFARVLGEVMQREWGEICDDTGCHPLDIERIGKRTFFQPNHWVAAIAAALPAAIRSLASPAKEPGQ
jgi:hypothetical protein